MRIITEAFVSREGKVRVFFLNQKSCSRVLSQTIYPDLLRNDQQGRKKKRPDGSCSVHCRPEYGSNRSPKSFKCSFSWKIKAAVLQNDVYVPFIRSSRSKNLALLVALHHTALNMMAFRKYLLYFGHTRTNGCSAGSIFLSTSD